MKHVPWIWHCFPVGRSFRKHHIVWATLSTIQCLASLPSWNWHVKLCVGTMPPWQVARLSLPERHNEHQILVPKVEANQAVLPPTEWEVRHCRSTSQGHFGKIKQCRNWRNTKAEKREHTRIPLSQFSRQRPQIYKQGSYTVLLLNCPNFFLSYHDSRSRKHRCLKSEWRHEEIISQE